MLYLVHKLLGGNTETVKRYYVSISVYLGSNPLGLLSQWN